MKACPQGGVLWCFIVDWLLSTLNRGPHYVQEHLDDQLHKNFEETLFDIIFDLESLGIPQKQGMPKVLCNVNLCLTEDSSI